MKDYEPDNKSSVFPLKFARRPAHCALKARWKTCDRQSCETCVARIKKPTENK